jgi:hypothetical protein
LKLEVPVRTWELPKTGFYILFISLKRRRDFHKCYVTSKCIREFHVRVTTKNRVVLQMRALPKVGA